MSFISSFDIFYALAFWTSTQEDWHKNSIKTYTVQDNRTRNSLLTHFNGSFLMTKLSCDELQYDYEVILFDPWRYTGDNNDFRWMNCIASTRGCWRLMISILVKICCPNKWGGVWYPRETYFICENNYIYFSCANDYMWHWASYHPLS